MSGMTGVSARNRVLLGAVLRVEIADELRSILREPTALLFSVLMPVGFFALFVSIFGGYDAGAIPAGTRMLATFGTFGVLSVTLMNPGVGVAQDRELGWLRAKRVSAVPVGVTLLAKIAAALPYAVGVLVAMTVTAALTGSLSASPAELLRVLGVLLVGSVPFALFGVAVGFRLRANAAAAVLNAVLMPAAVFSGLWMPLRMLPDFFADVAILLPTHHLARLALAQLDGGQVFGHVAVLLGSTAVAATAAGLSYRYARL
ncbi:ABC-2 type transport system permease protein [Actinopolyspora biskrensis]|uniref:ABC-2 type transport system permease protein n=2 Tax=Actinopolyspora biskrensis TaxID=1470178 RepID=A0A852Z8K0_9ACTN|nr:ABC-2 type transport system permease protein [Actinopolyspora biskrensis]